MRLNSGQNLHQFLTNSKSVSQNSHSNYNKIYNNTKIYNQSKSNINIINIENPNKRFNLFSNLNAKQKEKINLTKFLKQDKNYYNNINLMTEQNLDKKHDQNKLNLNLSVLSNLSKKGNSFKTLNYDRSSYVRIMKYFTIKSSNKPMKFDDLSPVFIPIRNTLSNEHRKNNNMNINPDSVKDKINFYYYINSKEKVIQLFKDQKNNDKSKQNSSKRGKNNNNNNSNNNNSNNNNDSNSGNYSGNNKMNNINIINKNEQRNSIIKSSDNNLTFSKNSDGSEFTFKDKGSATFNLENKKSNNKENNSNESSRNNNETSHNNILNSEISSFPNNINEKENKKRNDTKQLLIKNLVKHNNELIQNSCAGANKLSISVEKINNKDKYDNINYNNKNKIKYNNFIPNEEKKTDEYEDSPKFTNDNLLNNILNKEIHFKNLNDEKVPNILENILNNKNLNKNKKFENDINSNHMNTIDNNENNDNRNQLKNSYQFRIRKINLPSGINIASIQHNNKLLQNIMSKKSKKSNAVLNNNKIGVTQTEYKLIKDEKGLSINENRNLYNINERRKNNNSTKNLIKNKKDENNIKTCK